MNKMMKLTASTVALVGAFVSAFWNQPIYRRYVLDGKEKLKNLKIVFLSDLHNSIYGDHQQKLIEMIHKENPDLILAGGDMSDEKTEIDGSLLLFEAIGNRYPVYYVAGNHEYWMYKSTKVFEKFGQTGIIRLDNESIVLKFGDEQVTLIGVNDPDGTLQYPSKEALTRALDEAMATVPEEGAEGYKILLSHRPEHVELYEQYNVDLALSGHAHGGQGRIPYILNGLYTPNQGFFPKYAGGYYNVNEDFDFIVGRGLSFRKYLPRVCNPPEVVVITFIE